MSIVGQRIFLRPLTEHDVGTHYLEWMRDPLVLQYLESRDAEHSLESLRTFVKSMNESRHNHLFGIFEVISGDHIGNIKIGNIREPHLSADLGLIIGRRSAWGKGYGSEAIALATNHAFSEIGLNKLWAGMNSLNIGCFNAFMRAGYREIGRMRRNIIFDGRYVDSILVEKCREET